MNPRVAINMHRYDRIRGDNVPHAAKADTVQPRVQASSARDRISNFGERPGLSATAGAVTSAG